MKCNPTTGVCSFDLSDFEPIITPIEEKYERNKGGKIDVLLFTDVLCSYCWESEPEMNRFLYEYGDKINFYTVMGAMVKKWNISDMGDMKNELNMQKLWKEVADTYRMPSDGSAWIRETPTSSYPTSIVYNILRRKSHLLAEMFLRRAKELTFIHNRNAGSFANLEMILEQTIVDFQAQDNASIDFDARWVIEEAQKDDAEKYLSFDFDLIKLFQIEVFPSSVFVNSKGDSLLLQGKNSYEHYDYAIKEISGVNLEPADIPPLDEILGVGNYVFAREIEELYALKPQEVQSFIEQHLNNPNYEVQKVINEIAVVSKNTPNITL